MTQLKKSGMKHLKVRKLEEYKGGIMMIRINGKSLNINKINGISIRGNNNLIINDDIAKVMEEAVNIIKGD